MTYKIFIHKFGDESFLSLGTIVIVWGQISRVFGKVLFLSVIILDFCKGLQTYHRMFDHTEQWLSNVYTTEGCKEFSSENSRTKFYQNSNMWNVRVGKILVRK